MAPVATAEERVADRFRPTESAFPVEVDKVPAFKYASLAWQDSEDVLRVQRLSLFVS
jgi:hypothetical protein